MPEGCPRLLIDASTYAVNNNGDMAMFKVLLGRLRTQYPDARIAILTNDQEGITALDPGVEPVVVGDRWLWDRPVLGPIQETLVQQGSTPHEVDLLHEATSRIAARLQRAAPDRYWQIVSDLDPVAGRGGRRWQHLLDSSDAVILTGGGYFTDAFSNHAAQLLRTLDAGLQRRLPACIVGCGFEPVADRTLRRIGHAVLPRLTIVACREGVTSPEVLHAFGVDASRVSVTGDDAIELAYVRRPPTLGSAIGLSIRDHTYNPIDGAQYAALREVIQRFASERDASILPVPISNTAPRDLDAIERVIPGTASPHDPGIASLNTPDGVIAQAARCRIVLTGSYHAAVFALAMGIPAVCVTRSEHYWLKMRGLLAEFGARPDTRVISLDDPNLAQRLHAALADAWTHAEDDRASLLTAATAQIERGHATYELMFSAIDAAVSARGLRHAESAADKVRLASDADDLALMSVVERWNSERRQLHASIEALTRTLAAKDALAATLEIEATARLDKLAAAHAAIAEKEAMVALIAREAALRLEKLDAAHAALDQQRQTIEHLERVIEETAAREVSRAASAGARHQEHTASHLALLERQSQTIEDLHLQLQEKEAMIHALAHEAEQRRTLLQTVTDALLALQRTVSGPSTAEA